MKTLIKLLVFLLPLGVSAQLILETESSWDGSESIIEFGEPNTATYGQTFTTDGSNLSLDLIQFHLTKTIRSPSEDDVDFEVYVSKWDEVLRMATGSVVYESGQQTLPDGADWTTFSLNTGGLTLDGNEQYVFFLSASNFFDDITGLAGTGAPEGDPYSDGRFVFMNNGSEFDALFANTWDTWSVNDMAFRLEFSPVPEPATIGFLSIAGLGFLLIARKRLSAKRRK